MRQLDTQGCGQKNNKQEYKDKDFMLSKGAQLSDKKFVFKKN